MPGAILKLLVHNLLFLLRTQVKAIKIFKVEVSFTWKTLGADTRLARAEERVADIIPAIVIGPNTETICITCQNIHKQKKFNI
jgi:hypothetical protein